MQDTFEKQGWWPVRGDILSTLLDTSLLLKTIVHSHSILWLYAILEEGWEYPDSVTQGKTLDGDTKTTKSYLSDIAPPLSHSKHEAYHRLVMESQRLNLVARTLARSLSCDCSCNSFVVSVLPIEDVGLLGRISIECTVLLVDGLNHKLQRSYLEFEKRL